MNHTLKTSSLIAIFCALTLSLQAGLFFDDPVEMSLNWKPNLIAKDQVLFAPSGKHRDLLFMGADYTIEVQYQDHTSTFNSQQMLVSSTSPLAVDLPEGFKGIKAVSVKAKWRSTVQICRFKKNVRLPTKPTPKELAESLEHVKGLKVDSRWTVQ